MGEKKKKATEAELGELHLQMSQYFKHRLESANAEGGAPLSASELKEVREFLKDSGISASPDDPDMLELEDEVPFATEAKTAALRRIH